MVGAGAPLDTSDVLNELSPLVDQSLVLGEIVEGREPRYRMLQTNRTYAREKLEVGCVRSACLCGGGPPIVCLDQDTRS